LHPERKPSSPSHRAVFLDRDGVINRALVKEGRPYPPISEAELQILPGVESALQRLKSAGFLLIVATNQPDVARGTITREAVEKIHERLAKTLPIDCFVVCYHDAVDRCDCRKPQPGMLLAAAGDLDIELAGSYMVGDRWRDIEAGKRAGCKTFFVDYGYSEEQPSDYDFRVASLDEAASVILKR
jgi:D-glycero-D-manno-heptose 1,7-bisphosphate phosphatase